MAAASVCKSWLTPSGVFSGLQNVGATITVWEELYFHFYGTLAHYSNVLRKLDIDMLEVSYLATFSTDNPAIDALSLIVAREGTRCNQRLSSPTAA